MAKPTLADLKELREGGILWGYPHCVQQREITQTAVDRRQTLIAFEDMFVWSPSGQIGRHTFYKNNEMAGYCAVLHALQLKGIDGHYGDQRKVIIFSFGAVSRGAIYALKAHGFRDITICIQRPDHEVREEVLNCPTSVSARAEKARPACWWWSMTAARGLCRTDRRSGHNHKRHSAGTGSSFRLCDRIQRACPRPRKPDHRCQLR